MWAVFLHPLSLLLQTLLNIVSAEKRRAMFSQRAIKFSPGSQWAAGCSARAHLSPHGGFLLQKVLLTCTTQNFLS